VRPAAQESEERDERDANGSARGQGAPDAQPGAQRERLYSEGFMVEPTTQCNLKCPLCPVPAHMHRPGIHMSSHTYREVVDDIKGHAKLIALWNFGEPFLHPEIFDMIQYAEERGVPVRVSTNSTFLEDREIDKIFESGSAPSSSASTGPARRRTNGTGSAAASSR
jgi:uncharacterized radical SAM superfamily Fe-S cluster-containing enzyme